MAGKRKPASPFPEGNSLWRLRRRHGRKPIYEKPEDLLKGCEDYFKWCEENPLWESRFYQHNGVAYQEPVAKVRVFTLTGLCIYLGVGTRAWAEWRQDRDDLRPVIDWAEQIIYEQKFSHAAADLLNANIISRELGLADKQSVSLTGPDGGPVRVERVIVDPKSDEE